MRKKSMITSTVLFAIVGLAMIPFKQWEAMIIALSFSVVMGVGVITILLIEYLESKKLDKTYFLRRKEFIVKDYQKLTAEFDKNKHKAVSMTVFKFTKEHDQKTLKSFAKWLKEAFTTDPMGYDDGVIILFVNMHEALMPELIKQARKRLKDARIGVSFKSGFAYYTGNEDYETLKQLAEDSIK